MTATKTRVCAMLTLLATTIVLAVPTPVQARRSGPDDPAGNTTVLWDRLAATPPTSLRSGARADVRATRYVPLTLDADGMAGTLAAAPLESTGAARRAPLVLSLPTPTGGFQRFAIVESPVVAPELQTKYPQIRTYSGQGIDDPAATVRLDLGLTGFHAQVLSPTGAWYIDPYYHLDDSVYASYYRRDLQAPLVPFNAREPIATAALPAGTAARTTGTQLRTYRLALAADGEYSAFHGGTVPLVHNALVTAVNRVTGIYQTELSIKLQLVANNDSLIYLNASTDPYSNTNANQLLDQNQSTIDSVIGSANYDVGHVFTTGGGGLAGLGVVGKAGQKAWGETGDSSPTGDAYWVDYVAHEIGHEFGADHTFNGTGGSCSGNANSATAMEPGSGSSIMAYAGICGSDDLQAHSDAFFHAVSFDEIVAYTTTAGSPGNLGAAATTNGFPSVSVVGGPYTIPMRTPFALTATGSDPNGDPLTYYWEQYDGGALRALNSASKPTGALFRTFMPTTSPTRTFPKMSTILSNTTNATSGACGSLPGGLPCWVEFLPTAARSMNFRVTARDNRVDGGGVNSANTTVTVANVGPFLVTAPNTAVSYAGGSTQTVSWNVAGTSASPVSTANVNILLSTDGGTTFPTVLASNTPNDGTQAVTIPNTATSQARIQVQAAGNIFFDVSDANFTITGGGGGTTQQSLSVNVSGSGSVSSAPAGISCPSTCSAQFSDGTSVQLTATPAAGATFSSWGGNCSGTATNCTVSMTAARDVTATFTTSTTSQTLSVAKAGTGAGSVASSPSGIDCGATCSASYTSGTSVQLTATPEAGSTFTGWSGDCSGTATTCTVSMSAARSVTATFTTSGGGGGVPNDPFASPTGLTGSPVTRTGDTNVGATKEAGEPNHAGFAGGHSVWYSWTPASAGSTTIDTCGSPFDTLLGVYTGSAVSGLTTIASNDDSCGTGSRVTINAQAGVTYRIAIDGYGAATGIITLNLTQSAPPSGSATTTTVALSGGYGNSGGYRLYRVGTTETDTTTVSPDHTGSTFRNYVEKWDANRNRWVTYSGSPWTETLEAGSQTSLSWSPGRGKYRTWSVFPGDADHSGSQSAYVYYRFTS